MFVRSLLVSLFVCLLVCLLACLLVSLFLSFFLHFFLSFFLSFLPSFFLSFFLLFLVVCCWRRCCCRCCCCCRWCGDGGGRPCLYCGETLRFEDMRAGVCKVVSNSWPSSPPASTSEWQARIPPKRQLYLSGAHKQTQRSWRVESKKCQS